MKIDRTIIKEIKNNIHMNALHYLSLGTKYFSSQIINNKNWEQVSKIIIRFINILIDICLKKSVL